MKSFSSNFKFEEVSGTLWISCLMSGMSTNSVMSNMNRDGLREGTGEVEG